MDVLLFPLRLLYKIYFALYFALTLALSYPFFRFLLTDKKGYHKTFKLMRVYCKLWLFFSGVRLMVKGKENIKMNQPFLICSNHSSFLDIPCLYVMFDKYFVFTGKKEIEKWPLFRIFYTSGMNILVDRHNKKGALLAFKRMMDVIDEGYPLVVLPEGTISKKAPELTEFKTGAVNLAIKKQIPILPITFTTNWKRLQRKGLWVGKAGPGKAEAIVHPMLNTKGLTKNDAEALQSQLREIINQPLHQKYGVE